MAEYIKRKVLREILDGWREAHADVDDAYGCALLEYVIWEVDAQTAADVAPVVHGRWIRPHWKNSNYCYDCSECGGEAMHRDYQWAKDGIYPICPNCGAKMDLEESKDE